MTHSMSVRLVFLLWVLSAPAVAAEVVVSLTDGRVNVRIDALQYPQTLPRELTSGLTNRILARVTLLDGTDVLQQRTAEIAVRYDLWDQTFAVIIGIEGAVQSRSFADLAQLSAFLAALELRGLFEYGTLAPDRELVVSAELLLNPIGREKLGMIRKWVAGNSTPQPGGDSATSGHSELFNRIFEQYADGSQLVATWRVVVASRAFRLNSLPHE